MKKVLITLGMLAVSCMSFETNTSLDGRYVASNNQLYYGIEIDESASQLQFYVLPSVSSEMSKETMRAMQDWSGGVTANMTLEGDKIIVTAIASTLDTKLRNDRLELRVTDGKLYLNCMDIHVEFFGDVMRQLTVGDGFPCEAPTIEFVKQ